jgi:hypothetical protein
LEQRKLLDGSAWLQLTKLASKMRWLKYQWQKVEILIFTLPGAREVANDKPQAARNPQNHQFLTIPDAHQVARAK